MNGTRRQTEYGTDCNLFWNDMPMPCEMRNDILLESRHESMTGTDLGMECHGKLIISVKHRRTGRVNDCLCQ